MKEARKLQKSRRVRAKIHGTAQRPRLSVARSNKGLYLQLIDDEGQKTILGVMQKHSETKGTKTEQAKSLGMLIAKKAAEKKIKAVIFDRGSYAYHGRVKAVAEGAREGGLQF